MQASLCWWATSMYSRFVTRCWIVRLPRLLIMPFIRVTSTTLMSPSRTGHLMIGTRKRKDFTRNTLEKCVARKINRIQSISIKSIIIPKLRSEDGR